MYTRANIDNSVVPNLGASREIPQGDPRHVGSLPQNGIVVNEHILSGKNCRATRAPVGRLIVEKMIIKKTGVYSVVRTHIYGTTVVRAVLAE